MDHVAIMNKKFGDLIAKILSGEKKIESRWSKNKIAPWNRVKRGDRIYFKDSGGPVIAVAEIEKVRQFEKKDFDKARELFSVPDAWTKGKNYCVLMWLKNPKKIRSFKINKFGFGSVAAWLRTGDIEKIKVD
ncbi:TPA: hypothetical protein DCZ81_03885 [Candidatus Collierbacteria bacterium]|uniref:ASCH domain-containing protein n=2 Tax=Candidatus Amesiibacteriota TaxID=1752730 RepID=A0A0G1UPR5_9BACT|nr:MAG: hypothetical protein UX92_C0024G0003 [Candidatus Amesbacteria bacterium GW2011_GWA1_47_20]KKU84854.1 MAG: hypothetical protein UY11_C0002G0009 [Candidatus Amesbacteria bacterium GW2011_GWC2_47_8]HBC45281.1 hypothetical protein [Candidatus Collierbacteria bacterium]